MSREIGLEEDGRFVVKSALFHSFWFVYFFPAQLIVVHIDDAAALVF